ncbi:MAG TPA: PAS domain S-box protein, partial [Pirellulales bacterium]
SLVENAPDIITLTDLDGTIRFINRDTPIARQSIGRTTYDYIDEQHRQTMRRAFEELQKTGRSQTFEVHGQTETGQGTMWYTTSLGPIWQNERIVSAVLISTNITDRKTAEIRLMQSEAKWRSLVENAPDIIILTDPDGILQFVNRDTEEARRAVGRTVYDYIREPFWGQTRKALATIRATGQSQQFELRAHQQGGGSAWYTTRFGPIFHGDRLQSVIIVASDITHRKLAEERLERERQWLRRLLDLQERERQLVAYEIHDGLVQYLTGGLMHMEAAGISAGTKNARPQLEYDRGMSLLRDSLAEARRLISGLRPPILDEQGVLAALEYLINEARPDVPDIEFKHRYYFGRLAPPLEVAIFRITQEALSNIRLHSGSQRALIELLQHGEWVRLSIRDWGRGFEPDKAYEERFGLQGIRQRAQLLGTVALIESAPGQGTSIVVDFPLVAQPIAKEQ